MFANNLFMVQGLKVHFMAQEIFYTLINLHTYTNVIIVYTSYYNFVNIYMLSHNLKKLVRLR